MNKFVQVSKLFLKRNSATILTCVGAAGVVATAVLTAKSTPKALARVEEAKEEKGDDLTKLEIVKAAAPAYIRPAIIGAATITCVFGANVLNKRQQAAIMSAYALLDRSYKDYRAKVEDLYGEDANERVREELAKDTYEEDKPSSPATDKVLFYDTFGDRYFESTIEAVQRAEYRVNREIHMRGWVTLDEFYEYLDIDTIDGNEVLGWSEGGNLARYWQGWIDFNHHKVVHDDGLECTILTFFQDPYPCYEDEC